ncbi:hypothetical protein GGR51DRAFT_247822 [Nemania sp. FL0031]|nr:hypothetical protein GGR51DRAFT_247822 [Nemania sp. FL0031]
MSEFLWDLWLRFLNPQAGLGAVWSIFTGQAGIFEALRGWGPLNAIGGLGVFVATLNWAAFGPVLYVGIFPFFFVYLIYALLAAIYEAVSAFLRGLVDSIIEQTLVAADSTLTLIFAPTFLLESARALLMSFGVPSDAISIQILDYVLQLIPWALLMVYGALFSQIRQVIASQLEDSTNKGFWIFAGALYLYFCYANTLTWSTPWRVAAMSFVSLVVASSMARISNSFFRWRYVWLGVAAISLHIIYNNLVNFSWYWRVFLLVTSGFFVYILLQVLGLSTMAVTQRQPLEEPVRFFSLPPHHIVHLWLVATVFAVSDINYRVQSVGTDVKVIGYAFAFLAGVNSFHIAEKIAEAERIKTLARLNQPPTPPVQNQQLPPVRGLQVGVPYRAAPRYIDDDDFPFPENASPGTRSIFRAAARLDEVRQFRRRPPPPEIIWSNKDNMLIRYPAYESPIARVEEVFDPRRPLRTGRTDDAPDFVQAHLLARVDEIFDDEVLAAQVADALLRRHKASVILRIIHGSRELAAEYIYNCHENMREDI